MNRGDPDVLWANFSRHVQECPTCQNTDNPPCQIGHDLGEQWFHADQHMAKVAGAKLDIEHPDEELFL